MTEILGSILAKRGLKSDPLRPRLDGDGAEEMAPEAVIEFESSKIPYRRMRVEVISGSGRTGAHARTYVRIEMFKCTWTLFGIAGGACCRCTEV